MQNFQRFEKASMVAKDLTLHLQDTSTFTCAAVEPTHLLIGSTRYCERSPITISLHHSSCPIYQAAVF